MDDGIDPVEEKRQRRLKAELAAHTNLGTVAEEYIRKMEREGRSPSVWFHELRQNRKGSIASVPLFGTKLATLRPERNPPDILRGALTVTRVKHHAAIVEPENVGDLLRAINTIRGGLKLCMP